MVVEQSRLPTMTSILTSGLAGASVVPSQSGGAYERTGLEAGSLEWNIRGTSSRSCSAYDSSSGSARVCLPFLALLSTIVPIGGSLHPVC